MKEKEYFIYLDNFQNERMRMKIRVLKGKVVDMVVQYETKIKEQWKSIVRYDCAHGFFHRDFIFPNGDKEKKAISIIDLETALTYAEQDIKDKMGIFYKARYVKHKSK